MTQKTEDDSSIENESDSPRTDEAVKHCSLNATVSTSSFQALTSKKRAKPLYPSDLMDRFPAFPSSWPCQGRETASSHCPCINNNSNHSAALHLADTEMDTEAKMIDSDSSSEDANHRIRVSQDSGCNKTRDVLFLCPAAVIEQSLRQSTTNPSLSSGHTKKTSLLSDTSTDDDDEESQRQCQHIKKGRQSKASLWDNEAHGASGSIIGPEITTSKNLPNVNRTVSDSYLHGRRRQIASTDANDNEYNINNECSWDDDFLLGAPDMTETVRQQSMMSVPGAIAVPGINSRTSSDTDMDDETTSSMQEAMRRISNMDAQGFSEHESEDVEMTATIRQQSMMSVPGAIAVAGVYARSSSDADSDNETTISMQEALRRISTMDALGLIEHGSDAVEMTAAIRQQSLMSVPGAVAVDGINGRFGAGADSDDEATASMRDTLRCLSSNRGASDILVQGVLAAGEDDTEFGAYVSVTVIRQAPVIDAEGIHVIRVDDDELDVPDSMAFKASHWGGGLACLVVVAAVVCIAIFFIFGNHHGESSQKLTNTEYPTMSPTLAPTSSELPKIIDDLRSITAEAVLQDRASPQFMAAEWLSRDIADKELRHEKLIQRYVLAIMQFAYGITFVCDDRTCNYHESSTPFLTEADECTWNGITCNDDGLVTRILLFDRSTDLVLNDVAGWKPSVPSGKTGRISSEISTLTELSVLVIEGFGIEGSIEHIFHPRLKNLRTIRLAGNSLTGSLPGGIWKTHPNLEVLDFSNNQEISGPIPYSIGRIPSLKVLNLRNTNINGPIPSLIGSLASLEMLDLGRTLVEGSLPSEISGCSESLLTLDLSDTKMGGPLPLELERFHALEMLNLEGCAFNGPLPELPCSNTHVIRLNENNFSGTIPSTLGRCTHMEQLNLRDNPQLKGIIPATLCGDVWDYVQEFTSFSVDCDIVCDCCDFNAQCDDEW